MYQITAIRRHVWSIGARSIRLSLVAGAGNEDGVVAIFQPIQTPSLSQEALESFRDFEMKMYSEYQQMQKEFDFSVIEDDQSMQASCLTHLVKKIMASWK